MAATERKSDLKPTTDTPNLALTGELLGVYYEDFEKKNGRVIRVPHCMRSLAASTLTYNMCPYIARFRVDPKDGLGTFFKGVECGAMAGEEVLIVTQKGR